MKVLWLTNIPSPYRMNFFNNLGEQCKLTVLFERDSALNRDSSWKNYKFENFNGTILNGLKYSPDAALSLRIFKYLSGKYDHIVISNPLTLTGILAIFYLKLIKKDYIVVGDGGQVKSKKNSREVFKRIVLSGAKLYLSTGHEHSKYYLKYGAKKEKIKWYPFTSIAKNEILEKPVSREEKSLIKKNLGIKQEKVVLAVGRFVSGKGFDLLLKASSNLDGNVGVYLIGGEPTADYLNIKSKFKLENVHFVDFKEKKDLVQYFKAADVFVLPTRGDAWGLVINEAMANGLPVITTDKCVAGMELIVNYENGFVVPVDNLSILSEKLSLILSDSLLREKMARNNLCKISSYSIEEMVKRHIDILKEI